MFSIKVLPGVMQEGYPVAEIELGDHLETFPLVDKFWSPDDYRAQWREAVEQIVSGGANAISALIIDIRRPGEAGGMAWWPMYRDGDRVYFQEHLLFFDSLDKPFDYQNPYASVRPRGNDPRVSEWSVPLDSLKDFLANKRE
jgi:contact-dependent growth inhibition (CDI) system CdiI-like immunity protein